MSNSKLNIEITIGLSDMFLDLKQIPQAYEQAKYAGKSKFYSKGNRIILYSEIMEANHEIQYNIEELKHEIITAVDGNIVCGEEIISKYYKESDRFSKISSMNFSYMVINILQLILFENNRSLSELFEDSTIIWEKLAMFETIVDIRRLLINSINATVELINDIDFNRTN